MPEAEPTSQATRLGPADLDQRITEAMLPGFLRFDELVDAVTESSEDDVEDVDDVGATVAERATELWAARRRVEATWAWPSGEYHRLQGAFARLRTEGFVTGMDLGVDQGDGVDEAAARRTPDAAAPDGFREWAYVFFHQQDADRLQAGRHVLRLAFGAFRAAPDIDPDLVEKAVRSDRGQAAVRERSELAAGQQVAEVLAEHELDVDWDGTVARRIGVVVDEWRRPLPFTDLVEARRVVADEGLRVQWPGERGTADATALDEVDGRWHVWSTDERAAGWSDGTWHDDLGDALDAVVDLARSAARPPHRSR